MIEKGLLFELISVCSQSMAGVGIACSIEFLLTGIEERGSRKKRLTIWISFITSLMFLKVFLPLSSVFLTLTTPILMTCGIIAMLTYFYNDRISTKLIHTMAVIMLNVLPDLLFMAILGNVTNLDFYDRPFSNPYFAERCILNAGASILLHIIYITIVLKLIKKKKQVTSIWFVAFLTLFFWFFLCWMIEQMKYSNRDTMIYMTITFSWTILEALILIAYLSNIQKYETQEEIDKLSHIMQMEKQRYEQIEKQTEEMAKLRHDYNNILTSALFLLKHEQPDQAKIIIKDLQKRFENQKD